jgi:hypothetical protein
VLAQVEDHLAAGRGAARLYEAQVASGDIGFNSQRELTHAPALTPVAQQLSHGSGGGHALSVIEGCCGTMTSEVIALRLGRAQCLSTVGDRAGAKRKEITMTSIIPSSFLKRVLLADAAVSGAVALLQLVATDELAALTGLPAGLLLGTGLFLVGYVTLLIVLAKSSRVWSSMIWLVIAGNLAWAVAALAVAVTVPTALLGELFAAMHALAVTTFVYLEYRGLGVNDANSGSVARA